MNRVFSRVIPAARSYSTAAPKAAGSANLAPYFLGAGLVGAGAFYYSTLDQKKAITKTPGPPALSGDEFRNFKLKSVNKYNHNSSTFTFELPEGTSSGLTVASAVVVKSATEGQALTKKGGPKITPYTPVSAPDQTGHIDFLIKHYPGGVTTDHIFGLKPGDELAIKGPIPKFQYEANKFETVALIAGGSGITPMWQILQAIDANPADKTKAVLIYSNVTEQDILLRQEFESLAARKPDQFKIQFVLDQPPTNWTGEKGYISNKVLAQALPGAAYGDRLKIFVCGPPGQVNAISGPKASFKDQGELKGLLSDLGYKADQVYKF